MVEFIATGSSPNSAIDGGIFRGLRGEQTLRHYRIMRLIVPAEEVALIEVAKVKQGWRSEWRNALEEPIALWDRSEAAEALRLIDRLPEDDLYRCFTPGFGIRLHDEKRARAEVLFCFHCHMALMIDLQDRSRDTGETFDAESDPARELLARFQEAGAMVDAVDATPADASGFTGRRPWG